MREGMILSGVGGLYEILCTDGETVFCKARGIFRKEGIKPLLGDKVRFSEQEYIEEILPRRNSLIRPAVANMDTVLAVMAVHNPEPSPSVLEKILLEARRRGMEAMIVFNKSDLAGDVEAYLTEARRAYADAGIPVFVLSAKESENERELAELKKALDGKLSVIAGPSGVGKSSLINRLAENPEQEIGDLSERIARGKNTTRHARLLKIAGCERAYIADTPGFTSFHLPDWTLEMVAEAYPEFEPYEAQCRFADCVHLSEPDCAVKAAVERGEISRLRYEGYREIYQEVKQNDIGY